MCRARDKKVHYIPLGIKYYERLLDLQCLPSHVAISFTCKDRQVDNNSVRRPSRLQINIEKQMHSTSTVRNSFV